MVNCNYKWIAIYTANLADIYDTNTNKILITIMEYVEQMEVSNTNKKEIAAQLNLNVHNKSIVYDNIEFIIALTKCKFNINTPQKITPPNTTPSKKYLFLHISKYFCYFVLFHLNLIIFDLFI